MKKLARGFLLGILVLAAVGLLLAQKNPASGVWKLDVAKSKFNPSPGPKSATLTIDASGTGVKTTYDEIETDDSHIGYEYSTTDDDGKDCPVSGTARTALLGGAESVVVRHAGSNSLVVHFMKSAQIVATNNTVVSKDGKTLKITSQGADAKGQPLSSMTVWNKQ
jgi:hypothetical protein